MKNYAPISFVQHGEFIPFCYGVGLQPERI